MDDASWSTTVLRKLTVPSGLLALRYFFELTENLQQHFLGVTEEAKGAADGAGGAGGAGAASRLSSSSSSSDSDSSSSSSSSSSSDSSDSEAG